MKLPDVEKHGAAYWVKELLVYQYRTHRGGVYRDIVGEGVKPWVSSEFELSENYLSEAISRAIQRVPEVMHWMTDNVHYYETPNGQVYYVADDAVGTILPISGGDRVPLIVVNAEMSRRYENSMAWKQAASKLTSESTLRKVVKNGALGFMGFAIGGPLGAAAAISLGNMKTKESVTK